MIALASVSSSSIAGFVGHCSYTQLCISCTSSTLECNTLGDAAAALLPILHNRYVWDNLKFELSQSTTKTPACVTSLRTSYEYAKKKKKRAAPPRNPTTTQKWSTFAESPHAYNDAVTITSSSGMVCVLFLEVAVSCFATEIGRNMQKSFDV